jgi:hypothetical protein
LEELRDWHELRDWLGWLFVALCVLYPAYQTKKGGIKLGMRTYLRYSIYYKILALLFLVLAIYILIIFIDSPGFQLFLVGPLVVPGFFLTYLAFFVRISFDEYGVYCKVLFFKEKNSPWNACLGRGTLVLPGTTFMRFKGVGMVFCSEKTQGWEELAKMINRVDIDLPPQV